MEVPPAIWLWEVFMVGLGRIYGQNPNIEIIRQYDILF